MDTYTLQHKLAYIPTSAYLEEYWQAEHFIEFCKTCRNYQHAWACPPFDFEPLRLIQHYPHTYIIGTQVLFNKAYRAHVKRNQSAQTAGSQVMDEVRASIDPKLLALEQKQASRAYYAGSCHLCAANDCTRLVNQPCRHPKAMRPSLEAFGFDMGKTTSQLLNLELLWGEKGELPPYYILVSGWMSEEEKDCQEILNFLNQV